MVADLTTGEPLANARHEQFAQAVAKGHSLSAAYQSAYPDATLPSLRDSAAKLHAKPCVEARVAALRLKNSEANYLTKERKRELLQAIAEQRMPATRTVGPDGETKHFASVKALELDAKLAGELEPQDRGGNVYVTLNALNLQLAETGIEIGQEKPLKCPGSAGSGDETKA